MERRRRERCYVGDARGGGREEGKASGKENKAYNSHGSGSGSGRESSRDSGRGSGRNDHIGGSSSNNNNRKKYDYDFDSIDDVGDNNNNNDGGDNDDQDAGNETPRSGDCIGFATLPEQIHRKSVKRGFDFTLMVVGESGLGKSTMIDSLFLAELYSERRVPAVEDRIEKTVKIEKKMLEIEEQGVKLRLTIVDTPGFGDAVNNNCCWQPVTDYIESQFEQFFKDESGLNRRNIQDNRVHCCLYFISPIGHGLRPIDVEFMKRLHDKVNIIPVISKADTLTPVEIQTLKRRVLEQIAANQIKIYEFPETDPDEDEDVKQMDRELKDSLPYAVIGSNQIFEVNGKRVRGRQYPWGIVEVENPKHSDFIKLRTMLMVTHMHDLKDVTRDVHYENYRAQYITRTMRETAATGQVEDVVQLQQQHQQLQQRQMQMQQHPRMSARASSKEKVLKQKDAEIARMQEMILQMQKQLTTTTATTTTVTTGTTSTSAGHPGTTASSSSSSSLASQTGSSRGFTPPSSSAFLPADSSTPSSISFNAPAQPPPRPTPADVTGSLYDTSAPHQDSTYTISL